MVRNGDMWKSGVMQQPDISLQNWSRRTGSGNQSQTSPRPHPPRRATSRAEAKRKSPAEEISLSLPTRSPLSSPLFPSADRLLDRDRAHRARPGARAVAHLCHDPHDLIDGKGAQGVAAGVERRVPIESRWIVKAIGLPGRFALPLGFGEKQNRNPRSPTVIVIGGV
jgi:hypothetical protein